MCMFVLFRDGLSQQPKIFERQEKVNGHFSFIYVET
jgi:hypothetical protein